MEICTADTADLRGQLKVNGKKLAKKLVMSSPSEVEKQDPNEPRLTERYTSDDLKQAFLK